jgi:ATP-dependent Clp protease ATP-binding subunit ClpA
MLAGVFERFTEQARRVVVMAQEESVTLRHMYIGTEHLLLGLVLVPDEIAAPALERLGVSVEGARALVVERVGAGTSERTSGQIPFTPDAKGVLEAGLREALALGSNSIGPEHLLLGLARESETVGAQILLDLGADAEKVRDAVMAAMGDPPATRARTAGAPDMDRSWLDFTPDEACALAKRLAPLVSGIRFEVRPHGEGEHTFRVSCRPLGNDGTLRGLVALEADGIRTVLDHDGTVRLGRID